MGYSGTLAGCLSAPVPGSESFNRIPPDDERTQWGTPITIGDGRIRSFVTVDGDTGDKMVGAEFTPDIMNPEPLPTEHVLFSVPLPDHEEIPFTWLGLDWEPGGHYPGDKYAIPHYDFHFYFPPESYIAQIPEIGLPPETTPVEDLYTYPLPKDMIPPDYFRTNYTYPYMGEHLYNAQAPQYHGGTFGNSFAYGHWQGDFIFMEPEITLPYFRQLLLGEGKSPMDQQRMDQLRGVDHTDHRLLKSPDRFHKAGVYPTEYTVKYHSNRNVFTVTIHAFDHFKKTRGEASGLIKLDRGPEQITEPPARFRESPRTVIVGLDGELVFNPALLEIFTGESVTWKWDGSFHNVVPVSQPSDASWTGEPEISNSGHTYSHTFKVPGTYEYVCEPHQSQGMTGELIVYDFDETVEVGPNRRLIFKPMEIQINAGDTVLFDWKSNGHNIVPTEQPAAASWQGEPEVKPKGYNHVHTFDVPGRYEYKCRPHLGMNGTIIVGDG